jgi:predicted DNA-binding transcriptional regulator AlpA
MSDTFTYDEAMNLASKAAKVALAAAPVTQAWLSAQQAARHLGYSEQQFATFIAAGTAPPSIKFSRNARRFNRADLDAWARAGGPSQYRT